MGGFMQPQGHVQVLLNMIEDSLDPQAALDRPRFYLKDGLADAAVALEEGIPPVTLQALAEMGHDVEAVSGYDRAMFGRGQIIVRERDSGVLWGGSDPRSDGCAMSL